MRPLYLFLKFSLTYSLRLFYKRRLVINEPSERFGSTVYVSNHPNSFMDPLLIGASSRPVVHFMTRSDVFKWWLQPILWTSHMLPIYRQHDGEDTKARNADAFASCNKALRRGRNLLVFGEGFTDDVPIRGLKPVKKGAAKIGFGALEALNWSKNIYLCPIGVNYTDRNTVGSEYVLVTGDKICLNDYRAAYKQNPSKTINEITKLLETGMQEAITYVADEDWYTFHENIMQLTRKGINHENHDDTIPLETRWEYSRNLARWMNASKLQEKPEYIALKNDLDKYYALLKRMQLEDRFVLAHDHPEFRNRTREVLILLLTWPLALLGFIHGLIPYIAAKKLTEKIMRRKVFWGGVKMMLGKFFGTLYNIPIILWLNEEVFESNWYGVGYFLLIPELCRIAWWYARAIRDFRIKGKMGTVDVSKFAAKRAELVKRVKELVPMA